MAFPEGGQPVEFQVVLVEFPLVPGALRRFGGVEGFAPEEGIVSVLEPDGSRLDEVFFQGWEDVQREVGAVGAFEVAELGQQQFLPGFGFQRIGRGRSRG